MSQNVVEITLKALDEGLSKAFEKVGTDATASGQAGGTALASLGEKSEAAAAKVTALEQALAKVKESAPKGTEFTGLEGELAKAKTEADQLQHALTAVGDVKISGGGLTALSSDLEKANSSAGESGLGGSIGKLGPLAMGAAAAAAPMAAAFVFKGAVDETAKLGAEIYKLQTVTGSSAEGASALRAELDHFGVDADSGAMSLGRFENNLAKNSTAMDDGTVATKGLADKLRELGVNTADSTGKILPMEQLLPKMADLFQSMPDGADKTSLAIQAFGRNGTQLIPFLNEGSSGMADFTAKAKEMGLILDQSTINAIRQNALASKDMGEAMQGLQLQLGVALIPAVTAGTKALTGMAEDLNKDIIPAIKGASEMTSDFIGLLGKLPTAHKSAGDAAKQDADEHGGFLKFIAASNPGLAIGIGLLAKYGKSHADASKDIEKLSDTETAEAASAEASKKAHQDAADAIKKAADEQAKAVTRAAEDQTKAIQQAAEDQATAVTEAAQKQAKDVQQAAEDQASAVTKAAQKQAQDVKQIAEDHTRDVTRAAEDEAKLLKQDAEDTAKAVTGAAQKQAQDLKDAADDQASTVTDAANKQAADVKQAADDQAAGVIAAAQKQVEGVRRTLEDQNTDNSRATDDQVKSISRNAQDQEKAVHDAADKQAAAVIAAAKGQSQGAQDAARQQADALKKGADEQATTLQRAAEDQSDKVRRAAEDQRKDATRSAQDQESDITAAAQKQATEEKKIADQQAADVTAAAQKQNKDAKEAADQQASDVTKAAEQQNSDAKRLADDQASEVTRHAQDQNTETKRLADDQASAVIDSAQQQNTETKRLADEQATDIIQSAQRQNTEAKRLADEQATAVTRSAQDESDHIHAIADAEAKQALTDGTAIGTAMTDGVVAGIAAGQPNVDKAISGLTSHASHPLGVSMPGATGAAPAGLNPEQADTGSTIARSVAAWAQSQGASPAQVQQLVQAELFTSLSESQLMQSSVQPTGPQPDGVSGYGGAVGAFQMDPSYMGKAMLAAGFDPASLQDQLTYLENYGPMALALKAIQSGGGGFSAALQAYAAQEGVPLSYLQGAPNASLSAYNQAGQLAGAFIPGFAEGGIVTSPTLAMVGEAGPEAIFPLKGSHQGRPGEAGRQHHIFTANLLLPNGQVLATYTGNALYQQDLLRPI